MIAVIDITGQTFGRLTVQERVGSKDGKATWLCECKCGNSVIVKGANLKNGSKKSCGCLAKEISSQHMKELNKNNNPSKAVDLTGQKFGFLTVIERAENKRGVRWKCKCDCGNETIVNSRDLKSGNTKSCGCLKSNGEYKISQLLRENDINFSQQYRINYNNSYYLFDFVIYNNQNEIQYFIEYDGFLHYEYKNNGWNTKENFEKIHSHDLIKNKYCKENGIPLIRIPYTQYDNLCVNDLILSTTSFLI